MKLIFKYMKPYSNAIAVAVFLKFAGTMSELLLPYILEYMIDDAVPSGNLKSVIFWGLVMILVSFLCRQINVMANRKGVDNAHLVSYDLRRDLFDRTANLSGTQFDHFGLPSLISRMTSDSYNVQSCVQMLQMMCVRAPIMLLGGIIVTFTMDRTLSVILLVMVPILLIIIVSISRFGIPLYHNVQSKLDDIVRIMRENITGIRVVKALSKTEYEKRRFEDANETITRADIKASTIMAMPGPLMQTFLNVGLGLVIIFGAQRIQMGVMKPGVILAFLTYFNQVAMGVMGLNRIFIMLSKATASADRIGMILAVPSDQSVIPVSLASTTDAYIRFEHVNFSYHSQDKNLSNPSEQCLYDINFTLNKGESLGIIGPTGCGKTTIINLLMRFYDVENGMVYVDGRDVRSFEKDELHQKFGAVFQNDIIFNDTLRRNISFGRDVTDVDLEQAVENAQAMEFVEQLEEKLDYKADIKGANLSGGQRQRILISRALAAHPEILILDDSSSALDYQTDAKLRKAIFSNAPDTTIIMIAQRISSIQNMTNILVLDNGKCIGYGKHEDLLKSCRMYKDIYETQMGSLA